MSFLRESSAHTLILIIALILGIFLIYREFCFWRSYKTLTQSLAIMDVSKFENNFNKRLDRFQEKEQEIDRKMAERSKASIKKYEAFLGEPLSEDKNEESIKERKSKLTEELTKTINEMIDFEIEIISSSTLVERYQFLHDKLLYLKEIKERLKAENNES